MNYLKQINALYDRMETNPISAHAQSLWFCLMQVNNRARWKKTFSVSLTLLCARTSIAESTLRRARKELEEKGYIRYFPQTGNRAAMYEMIILYEEEVPVQEKHEENSAVESKAGEYAKKYLAPLSTENVHEISKWEKQVGTSTVIQAVDIAVARGKVNWNDVRGILYRWKMAESKQIRTYAIAGKKANRLRTEVVPPWFEELKKQETQKNERKRKQNSQALTGLVEKLKAEYFAMRERGSG